ncbi:MAG TPA: hypothetical protein VIL48_11400 [Acidimicrobiales bacterium]
MAGIVVPVALFTWRALRAPVNFDGGMNLQVAESLAHGDGYTRFYHALLPFPHEVQTNGPFMWTAALSIRVLGENQLAYQLTNLLAVAGLAGVVAALVRERPVLRVVGPGLVLLAAPTIAVYGLGALGEVPMTAFLLASVLALAAAVRAPERAVRWLFVAGLAFGAAFATKTFAQGAAGGFAVGVAGALVAVAGWPARARALAATVAGVLAVPALRELHRLVGLEGIDNWRAWWAEERTYISSQSGFEGGDRGGPVQTFLDHMHTLAGLVDFPAELLLGVLFLPLVAVVAVVVWRWRADGLRRVLTDPALLALLVTAVMAVSYIGWWMLLVPERKAWIRRILPGLLLLDVVYLLLAPWVMRAGRAAWARWRDRSGPAFARRAPALALAGALALAAVTALPYAAGKLTSNGGDLVAGEPEWLDATRAAAAYVESHDEQRFYGDEWWSAPVVSLMSGVDFYNLGDTPSCSLDPARDRLVWDYDAKTRLRPEPWTRSGRLVFEEVATFGEYVSIYAVGPAPGRCS